MEAVLTAAPMPAAGQYRRIRVTPASPAVGGILEDVQLAALDEDGIAELKDALWRHGVLFARGQNLSFDAMKRLAGKFGDALEKHTFGKTLVEQGHPEVLVIQKSKSAGNGTTTDVWHHDVTGRVHPNLMSILQAEEVPFGADTMWASMSAAYARLPHALKLMFLNLDIEHDTLFGAMRHGQVYTERAYDKLGAAHERCVHPAVIHHPFTGKPCLFVGNAWSKRVLGCNSDQSELLLRLANDMAKVPEIQVRWSWRKGDVALWDNFGTTHYGVSGDAGTERRLYRVSAVSSAIRPSLDRALAVREQMEIGA